MKTFFDSIRNASFRRGPSRLVAGISGGLAAATGLNVWLVRALVLLAFALPFVGVGLYLFVWALTPWQDGTIPVERALASGRQP